jgi:hypothetical protein
VAIIGASGAVYGVRLLEQLRASGACESHLVMSASGALMASQELDIKRADFETLADVVHNAKVQLACGGGRHHALAIPFEQLLAEVILEPRQLHAERRLHDAEPADGARHAAFLVQANEILNMAQVHRLPSR